MNSMQKTNRRRAGAWLAVLTCLPLTVPLASGQDRPDPEADTYRKAVSFDFGAFCVEDIPLGSVTHVGRPRLRMNGVERSVTLRFESEQPAKVYFFENSRPSAGIFDACDDEVPGHARRILEGSIRAGTIEFRIVEPQGLFGRATKISDGGLDLRLGQVRTSFTTLYGGSVVPGEVDVRVGNVGHFESNPGERGDPSDDRLEGTLSIGSYRLGLTDAQLLPPGFERPVVLSFEAVSKHRKLEGVPSGVVFHVDLPSGDLRLAAGGLVSTGAIDLGAGQLKVAGAEATVAAGTLAEAQLVMRHGEEEPQMELRDLALDVSTAIYAGAGGVQLVPSEGIQIARVFGRLIDDRTVATIHQAEASGLEVPAAELKVGGAEDLPTLQGSGSLKLTRLSESDLEGQAHLKTLTLPALTAVAPLAGCDLFLSFDGPPSAPRLEGSLGLSALSLGSLAFDEIEEVRASFSREVDAIHLPFRVEGEGSAGGWALTTPEGEAALDGRLGDLRLAGAVSFDPTAGARLTIEPQGLLLEAEGAAVLRPILFGTAPQTTTLGGAIHLASANGFTIDRDGSRGSVQLSAEVLVATGANLIFDDPATGGFRVDQPLTFDAGATLGFQLSDLSVSLLAGHARIETLSAIAEGEQPVRLADLELAAPRLSAELLEVKVTSKGATVSATDLRFSADRIAHRTDPVWQLESVEPRFPRVEALLGRVGSALAIEEATVHDLSLTAARGSYRSRDGFEVAGEGAHIAASKLSSQRLEGGRIAIDSGSLRLDVTEQGRRTFGSTAFKGFEVLAQGEKDHLSGTGKLRLEGLRFHHDFPLLNNGDCENDLQLRASLAVGSVDLDLRLEDAELHGGAELHSVGLRLRDTDRKRCEWNERYEIDILRPVTETVCSKEVKKIPLAGEFVKLVCKEVERHVNVSVPVGVRWRAKVTTLDLRGTVRRVELNLRREKGVGFCLHDASLEPGGFHFLTVVPTFSASGDVGKAVKGLVDTTLEVTVGVAESTFTNSVTNIGGLLTNLFPVDHCQ